MYKTFYSIERCPVFGGKVKAFDGSAAMKIKGVKAVLKTDRKLENNVVEGSGVAVVADSYWAALKARKALVIEWDYAGNDKVSSDSITANFQNLAQQEGVIDSYIFGIQFHILSQRVSYQIGAL